MIEFQRDGVAQSALADEFHDVRLAEGHLRAAGESHPDRDRETA